MNREVTDTVIAVRRLLGYEPWPVTGVPRCAVCGDVGHRYSTVDPNHEWDGVACANQLRGRLDDLLKDWGK